MRKLLDFFNQEIDSIEEFDEKYDYDHIVIEIIDDVVKKKKDLHIKYNQLFEKLWISAKSIQEKKLIAKKLLNRLLKESDQLFLKAQILATKLCPVCEKARESQKIFKFSDSLH
ncbi:MAG: hypothetical protein CMM95_00250 [Rickettsiales bacterium]|nr:hypothetical protein [Rickettsiales bacterium]|tara:strand:+ start:108 stop:449 length:342 start_codon:yes stop_codon:yes gene_type:complete